MTRSDTDRLTWLSTLIDKAQQAGATAADAVLFTSISQSAGWRLGKLEELERAEAQDVGLRVFIGQRQAIVSSTDHRPESIDRLVERAVAMAKIAPQDPWCGLADADLLAGGPAPELDLADSVEPTPEELKTWAGEAEEAALAVPGVTNSSGAGASWDASTITLVTSHGFSGSYAGTHFSISASVVAGEGADMETDYDYATARHRADLDSAAAIGTRAGERTVRRLGARKMPSASVPVIFEPRVSASLLGHLAGAIAGPAVARGTSFLKDCMGEAIFPAAISVIDDPTRRRGLRSKPFDGEGLPTTRQAIIEDGRLTTWLLDSASARQLGLPPTGHASRGVAAAPSPAATNLYLEAGALSPEELRADIKSGLYVTDLIGMGVNPVTGDYSRGAAGFWIEDGEIAFPVSELTIAGNLMDMFRALTPANDLTFRYGVNAPSLRIDGMTVAGA